MSQAAACKSPTRLTKNYCRYTTGAARQANATARPWQRLRDTVSQLEEALVSRTDIDQAIGALRVLNGGSAEDAFAVLVERSQSEDIKVRDLALRIVEDLSRSTPRDRAVRAIPRWPTGWPLTNGLSCGSTAQSE